MRAFQLKLPGSGGDYAESETSNQSDIWKRLTYLFVYFDLLQLHMDYCDNLNVFEIRDKKN
jgi:hypothetical protein